MKIKNITTLLVTATLLGAILPLQAQSIENTQTPAAHTSSFFKDIVLGENQIKNLRAKNVSGSDVSIIPVSAMPDKLIDGFRSHYGDDFSITGTYEGKDACVVVADTSAKEGIVPLYSGNSLYGLVDRDVQHYYRASHELSHCLNSNTQESLDLLNAMIMDPALKQYGEPLNALESSSREAHADLMASLLGASKTGDWTVFNQAILPVRTSYFDPTHSTAIAVGNIIDRLDPAELKGQSFEAVTAFGNELFRRNFMDDLGRLNPRAPGMIDILKDWQAASLETELYMTHEGVENTPDENRVLANIVQYRKAAELIAGKDALHQLQDLTFAYALKSVNLESQIAIAKNLMVRDSAVLADLIDSNENKVANLEFIVKLSADNYHGASKSFAQGVKDIKAWQRHFHREYAPNELAKALAYLGTEALSAPGDAKAIAAVEKAERDAKTIDKVSSPTQQKTHAYVVSNLTSVDTTDPEKQISNTPNLTHSPSDMAR